MTTSAVAPGSAVLATIFSSGPTTAALSTAVDNVNKGYVIQASWTVPPTAGNLNIKRFRVTCTVTAPLP